MAIILESFNYSLIGELYNKLIPYIQPIIALVNDAF